MKRIRDSKNLHNYPSLTANMQQMRLCVERIKSMLFIHRYATRENGFIRSLTHFKCFLFVLQWIWIRSNLTIVQLSIYFFEQLHHKRPKIWSGKWPCTLFCVYEFFKVLFPSCLLLFGMKKDFFTSMAKLFCDFHHFLTNLMYRYKQIVAGMLQT